MKFRLYSHKQKLYTNDPFWPSNQRTFSEWFVSPNGEIVELVGFPDGENVWYSKVIHVPQDFAVEHFTGFYDKNAKKIFQGDVLLFMGDFIATKYQVIWQGNGFKIKGYEHGHTVPFLQDELKDYEVVGTIHD